MSEQHYDIIGDVHGHADALRRLLVELGYAKSQGAFRHDTRKAMAPVHKLACAVALLTAIGLLAVAPISILPASIACMKLHANDGVRAADQWICGFGADGAGSLMWMSGSESLSSWKAATTFSNSSRESPHKLPCGRSGRPCWNSEYSATSFRTDSTISARVLRMS
jgi:hypothetical protein